MPEFAPLTLGRWRYAGAGTMPRHRHGTGYVALVLSGGYEEIGDCGRFHARAGDVLCHRRFEAHLDRFPLAGADTINFDLDGWSPAIDFGRVDDPDLIVRTAERDWRQARDLLLALLMPADAAAQDWPDKLATDIRRDPDLRLAEWA